MFAKHTEATFTVLPSALASSTSTVSDANFVQVEREPNSKQYWRNYTSATLQITVANWYTCEYLAPLGDAIDRYEKKEELAAQLRNAIALKEKIHARHARIYGDRLIAGK